MVLRVLQLLLLLLVNLSSFGQDYYISSLGVRVECTIKWDGETANSDWIKVKSEGEKKWRKLTSSQIPEFGNDRVVYKTFDYYQGEDKFMKEIVEGEFSLYKVLINDNSVMMGAPGANGSMNMYSGGGQSIFYFIIHKDMVFQKKHKERLYKKTHFINYLEKVNPAMATKVKNKEYKKKTAQLVYDLNK